MYPKKVSSAFSKRSSRLESLRVRETETRARPVRSDDDFLEKYSPDLGRVPAVRSVRRLIVMQIWEENEHHCGI